MGRKQEGVKEGERMEDGAEVGGAEDQDELREASVKIRLESCVAEDLHV